MPRPLASFVIPMYNGAATIAQTIASLQAQSEPDWEAVIVNDGSTDDSPALVEALGKHDPRIRLLHRPNGGRAKARNTGLDAFSGEYCVLLDADDEMMPHALAELIGAAANSPWRSAAGQVEYRGPDNQPLGFPPSPSGLDEVGLDDLLSGRGFQLNAQVIHRDTLGSTRKREHIPIYEDMDLFFLIAEKGVRWTLLPRVVATYRLHHNDRSFPKFYEYSTWYVRLIRECFERSRELGWQGRGVDVSPERERRAVRDGSWQFAHLLIHQDPTARMDHMSAIIALADRAAVPATIDQAVDVARHLVPMAEERPLDTWKTDGPRYVRLLLTWWRRCRDEGWADPNLLRDGLPALARRFVDDDQVAREMARRARDGREIEVFGLGRNGRRVVQALAECKLPFVVRDDGIGEHDAASWLQGTRGRWKPRSESPAPGALALMTPLHDRDFLASLPADLPVIRWNDVSDELASPLRRTLESAAQECAA